MSAARTNALPHRPRLTEQAWLRRHRIDGIDKVVIHDRLTGELLAIDERTLAVVQACDGTRDLGGVMLAAHRAGAQSRRSDIARVLLGLAERGLLADGLPTAARAGATEPDRPLEVLADFTLCCEEHGACCQSYGSVAFTAEEAERAVTLAGDPLGSGRARLFSPLYGGCDEARVAVALVDGRCAFLASDGRCRIERAGGRAAKPRGCRSFPATFVDDGQAVRVSVALECACVLASLGKTEGAPLVPPGARRAADLEIGSPVVTLPDRLRVTTEREASPAELRRWSEAVLAAPALPADAVRLFWSLAEAVQARGLDLDAARAAVAGAPAPSPDALAIPLASLADRARDRSASAEAWRSPRDRTRLLTGWLATAAEGLRAAPAIAAQLGAGPTAPASEAFYLRAVLFGHQLCETDRTVHQALRDRAVRALFARALGDALARGSVPAECARDPAAQHPLTAVEAMMRGQGLGGYAIGPA